MNRAFLNFFCGRKHHVSFHAAMWAHLYALWLTRVIIAGKFLWLQQYVQKPAAAQSRASVYSKCMNTEHGVAPNLTLHWKERKKGVVCEFYLLLCCYPSKWDGHSTGFAWKKHQPGCFHWRWINAVGERKYNLQHLLFSSDRGQTLKDYQGKRLKQQLLL